MPRRVNTTAKTLEKDPLMRGWVDNTVAESTGKIYLINFATFYDWLQVEGDERLRGLSPKELLQLQYQLILEAQRETEDIFDSEDPKLIIRELAKCLEKGRTESGNPWRRNYKSRILNAVFCFFNYYLKRKGLVMPELDNGEMNKALRSSVGKSRKELTIEILRDVINSSMPMYKAVFSIMLASGMDLNEVVKWSNRGIESLDMDKIEEIDGRRILEVWFPNRKGNLDEFWTYIGGSALDNMEAWLKHRDKMESDFGDHDKQEARKRWRKPGSKRIIAEEFTDSIFVNNSYKPLTEKGTRAYWIGRLTRLQVITRVENGDASVRYNKALHQTRSIFRSRWAKIDFKEDGHTLGAEAQKAVGEYLLGHNIDKLGYQRVAEDHEFRKKIYVQAIDWLDVDKINIERQSEETILLHDRVRELEAQINLFKPYFKIAQRVGDQREEKEEHKRAPLPNDQEADE